MLTNAGQHHDGLAQRTGQFQTDCGKASFLERRTEPHSAWTIFPSEVGKADVDGVLGVDDAEDFCFLACSGSAFEPFADRTLSEFSF